MNVAHDMSVSSDASTIDDNVPEDQQSASLTTNVQQGHTQVILQQ